LEFRITDTNVFDLDTFVIDHINLNVLRMTLDLNMTLPELKVQGKHDTTAYILDKIPIRLVGTGDYTMVLKSMGNLVNFHREIKLKKYLNFRLKDWNVDGYEYSCGEIKLERYYSRHIYR
jgi:hypothetical protein